MADNSGSAFPSTHHELIPTSSGGYPSGRVFTTSGLSKRELFAAMAMQAEIPRDIIIPGPVSRSEWIAQNAVIYADALILELSKNAKD